MAQDKVDILIPVHNALAQLQECIYSVDKNTTNFRYIIVNDYSTQEGMDNYLKSFQQTHPDSLVISTGKQKWFTRAVNLGLRLVRTDRVVILNSDTIPRSGWLEELMGVWQDASERIYKDVGLVGSFYSGDETRRYAETVEPLYVTGHCWLASVNAMNRAAFTRGTPGWVLDETDPGQIHINSDKILCYEMNRIGLATFVSFKSHVDHIGGVSWNYDLAKVSRLDLADVD